MSIAVSLPFEVALFSGHLLSENVQLGVFDLVWMSSIFADRRFSSAMLIREGWAFAKVSAA
jgi:hypothetical protein